MSNVYLSLQGNMGLSKAIDYFTSHQIPIAIPMNDTQKYDLIALFGFSGTKEEKEPVRVATCYYAEWREFAWNQIRPIVVDFLNQNFTQLANYYDALATAYHEKLASLLADQESEKGDY